MLSLSAASKETFPMSHELLDWIKVIGPLAFSWPIAGLLIALLFRKPLLRVMERFTTSEQAKAEIGPVKIELGKLAREGKIAVDRLSRLNMLMAESRLLELEITAPRFGPEFSAEQRTRMQRHIDELRRLIRSDIEVPSGTV